MIFWERIPKVGVNHDIHQYYVKKLSLISHYSPTTTSPTSAAFPHQLARPPRSRPRLLHLSRPRSRVALPPQILPPRQPARRSSYASPPEKPSHTPTSFLCGFGFLSGLRSKMYSPQLPLARTRVVFTSEMEKSPQAEAGSLEDSLLQLLRDHQHSSVKLRQQTEIAKKESIKNAKRVSDILMDAMNGGVQECYLNEKRIELEIRGLSATIARFMKQTDHWLATTNAINTAMKEIGDFENWMKTMDFDCKSINTAIRNIYQE